MKKIPNPWYDTTTTLCDVYADFVLLTGVGYGDEITVLHDTGTVEPRILSVNTVLDFIRVFIIERDSDDDPPPLAPAADT